MAALQEDIFVVPRDLYKARSYATVKVLREGGVVDLDGLFLVRAPGDIAPGDMYVAERNTGPHLLTAKYLKMGAVFPTTQHYPFDTTECVKVAEWTP